MCDNLDDNKSEQMKKEDNKIKKKSMITSIITKKNS